MASAAELSPGPPPVRPRYLDAAAPVAFEDLLIPFVEAVGAALAREAGDALHLLSGAARAALERSLLAMLSEFALATFSSEFALHRGLHALPSWAADASSTRSYRQFVAEMLDGRLDEVMAEYPALARLLAGWSRGWAVSNGRLLRHLRDDWPAIRALFGIADPDCRIEAVSPYLSDPHDDGAAVSVVRLTGGEALVHKPRSLAMEAGLGRLLAWANEGGFSRPYRDVVLLACGDHGWMELIEPAACGSAADINSFYRRIGGLICLVALLQGTDIHYENLIAAGDQPVIVDAETLFQPRLRPEAVRALGAGAGRSKEPDDILKALSECGFFRTAHRLDFSALGTLAAVDTPFFVPRAVRVNSDQMSVELQAYRAPHRQNVPSLLGEPAAAASHGTAIVAGFEEMFRLAVERRQSLLALVAGFAAHPVRLIVRSTNVYGLLLQAARQPAALRGGAHRVVLFDRLGEKAADPACGAILAAEVEALERMNVPHLIFPCDEKHGCWPSPLGEVMARIGRISEADLERCLDRLDIELSRLVQPPDELQGG